MIDKVPNPDPAEWNKTREARQCDPHVYSSILLRTKLMLDMFEIQNFLGFGTLLGAVRDGNFIPNDQDVDILILEKDEDKLVRLLQSNVMTMMKMKLLRVHSPFLVSIGDQDQYCDIYVMRDSGDNYQCWEYKVEKFRLDSPDKLDFLGLEFDIPQKPEEYLERVYGDWRTPSDKHAES